jgi:hypothetical protein
MRDAIPTTERTFRRTGELGEPVGALFTLSNDMDENTTGAFVAMGIALAIFAVVIFTLPMPPKRRRH